MPGSNEKHTVLVTGAGGFIGQALCARLAQEREWTVRALLRRPSAGPWHESFVLDLATDAIDVAVVEDVRTVFHLAGRVHALDGDQAEQSEYVRVNVHGTRALLEAAVQAGVEAFIFFSSVKACGEGGRSCLDEDCSLRPRTAYGRSKQEAERAVLEAGRLHSLRVTNLRLPLVYGEHSKGNLVTMLRAVARNRFPPLAECGNKRSMVHVEDVVDAALLASRRPQASGKTYIVTDGAARSTREIYTLMCVALNKSPPTWSVPVSVLRLVGRIGDVCSHLAVRRCVIDSTIVEKLTESAWYSSAKIEQELGFRPSHDLKQALSDMVRGAKSLR
jgi:nucleoside-diphosphate-sugar epimerase